MGNTGIKITAIIFIQFLLFASCSTQPKNPGDIYELRKQAEAQLDLGNKLSDRGNNDEALILINEAQRLAIISDDTRLIIRTSLSRGNVLINMQQTEEAAGEFENALAESLRTENREFTALSRIHISRYMLLTGRTPAQKVKEDVSKEMGFLKTDKLYIAFAWMVCGLAEKEMGKFTEAEADIKQALNIHEKGRYLEQAAYDWFLIASFRSLKKNYPGAQDAMMQALALDRRIENSYGLATDWRALGDIHAKAGNTKESREAYLRSADIFRALGNDEAAEEVESRIRGDVHLN